jgi:LysM repeat protein
MMSDFPDLPQTHSDERRCPSCDAVVTADAVLCLMCGSSLEPSDGDLETAVSLPNPPNELPILKRVIPEVTTAVQPAPEVVELVMKERQTPLVLALTAVFFVIIVLIGGLILQYQSDEVSMVIAPSITPILPTVTFTPTWTPLPSETAPPTQTPTITPTPAPTDTPRPPRSHIVSSGQTLIGISLLYQISPESIAEANNFTPDTQVQLSQELLIPWPTPTPPLQIIAAEINGETVIADPADCEFYQVQGGDSIVGIASFFGVPFDLLAQVNRIADPSLLQPGDPLCIPEIIYGQSLPPTPGPSPTVTETAPPPGPQLLYPVAGTVVDSLDAIITLQWAAVKPLNKSEMYMVELTNINGLDSLPQRGFTRDTAFRVPSEWRPITPNLFEMRWRVSIVQVTAIRSDGLPIYTFGGSSSADAFFAWQGAVPTATPTPTQTPTVTPTP